MLVYTGTLVLVVHFYSDMMKVCLKYFCLGDQNLWKMGPLDHKIMV